MLKETFYEDLSHLSKTTKVVYIIVDGCCYFSGIETGTSTINAAENVIQAIAEQEGVSVDSLRYFDIQTRLGGYEREEGCFEINELDFAMGRERTRQEDIAMIGRRFGKVLKYGGKAPGTVQECKIIPTVTGWKSAVLPEEILEEFRPYIGEKPVAVDQETD